MRKLLLLLLLLMLAGSSRAQTIVQSCTADGNGAGSNAHCTMTVGANHHLLVVTWGYLSPITMTDTFGLTWSGSVGCNVQRAGPSQDVMKLQRAYTGANSGSETVTANSVGTSTIIVVEVSGLLNTTPDPANGACAGDSTSLPPPGGTISSGNVTTTVDGDFVFGAGMSAAGTTLTAGSGFTEINRVEANFGGDAGPVMAEWKSAGTAGSYDASASQSSSGKSWIWFVWTFKTSASAPSMRSKIL